MIDFRAINKELDLVISIYPDWNNGIADGTELRCDVISAVFSISNPMATYQKKTYH